MVGWCREVVGCDVIMWWGLLLLAVVNAEQRNHCDVLEDLFAPAIERRSAVAQGRAVPLVVQCEAGAARAAAALLCALLRRAARYDAVRLQPTPAQPLGEDVYSNRSAYDNYYDQLEMNPAAGQQPGAAPPGGCLAERLCALRRAALGAGAAPAGLALAARPAPRAPPACRAPPAHEWGFYTSRTALLECGYIMDNGSAVVFYLHEHAALAAELSRRAAALGVLWRVRELGRDAQPRAPLLKLMEGNQSFLFLDSEVWLSHKRTLRVHPPGAPLERAFSLRVGHVLALEQFVPDALHVFGSFAPEHGDLREIMEEEAALAIAGVNDPEQAACAWALRNIDRVRAWTRWAAKPVYWVAVYICDGPDYDAYRYIMRQVRLSTENSLPVAFELYPYKVSCTDAAALAEAVNDLQLYRNAQKLVGVVAAGEGARAAAVKAKRTETALILADVVPDDSWLNDATRAIGGDAKQLASAVERLMKDNGWARLAVISDKSSLAQATYKALRDTDLILRNVELKSDSPEEIGSHLAQLREVEARIVFVNAGEQAAGAVICAGAAGGMARGEGYVWLARDWRAGNHSCGGEQEDGLADMRLFSVSFWWRGHPLAPTPFPAPDNQSINGDLRERLQAPSPAYGFGGAGLWPPRGAALADCLRSLCAAAAALLAAQPARTSDLHGVGTASLLWSSLNVSVPGLTGPLTGSPRAEPLVYVDEWTRGRPRSAAVWRAGGGAVSGGVARVAGDHSDGGRRCLTTKRYVSADRFCWRCDDWAFALAACCALLAPPALLLARRARLARLKRRERMLKARHEARERRLAGALGPLLVARGSLSWRGPLGAGRHGLVRLAVLRHAPVAVKQLPDHATPADEADFLKEACTLASLSHAHIIRLLGVCASDGPPLLLMEHAFFGDLAAYLRARRHLAEQPRDRYNEEAEHVSAASLTRLAGEAAAALAYLETRNIVHRDVRAANCLVDERRSLKLADFGLARRTLGAEYACARRGLFPVLWMAPESLSQGVFSPASDAWALGVLILELVTLGARPYGRAHPAKVVEIVRKGGRPPLPADASIKTVGVLLWCWRRPPAQRPRAAALQSYLASRPAALAPALAPPPRPPHLAPDTLDLYELSLWTD